MVSDNRQAPMPTMPTPGGPPQPSRRAPVILLLQHEQGGAEQLEQHVAEERTGSIVTVKEEEERKYSGPLPPPTPALRGPIGSRFVQPLAVRQGPVPDALPRHDMTTSVVARATHIQSLLLARVKKEQEE